MTNRSRWARTWDGAALHWNRTNALVAGAGIVVATAVGLLIAFPPWDKESTPAADQPAVNSQVAGAELCGPSSETDLPIGWGPERLIYTDTTFPDSLTFNSTYKNENLGDERNWVAVKSASDTEAGGWLDEIEIEPGQEYLVRAYVRLDGPIDQAATKVLLRFNMPTCTAHRIGTTATLSSENTFPSAIWDGTEFWSRDDFTLTVVPDSAVLYSNRHPSPEGLPLATYDLVSATGVQLASDEATGEFLPGYSESVYVCLRVIANAA